MGRFVDYFRFDYNKDKKDIEYILDDYVGVNGDDFYGLPKNIEWIDSIVYPDCNSAKRAIDDMDIGDYRQIAVPFMGLDYDNYGKKICELQDKIEFINNEIKDRNSIRCKSRLQKVVILKEKLQRLTKKKWLVKIEFPY